MKITLCATCMPDAENLAQALHRQTGAEVVTVECMSGCIRPGTAAFRESGKTAYLFGDLGPGDLADLVNFARHYHASPDGNFADARPLGDLRTKAIARIPG